MNGQLWSWALAAIGVFGLYVAGSKKWWGWTVGIGAQVLWVIYALVTEQYGFLASAAAYGWVYTRNARLALKQHHINQEMNHGSEHSDAVRSAADEGDVRRPELQAGGLLSDRDHPGRLGSSVRGRMEARTGQRQVPGTLHAPGAAEDPSDPPWGRAGGS